MVLQRKIYKKLLEWKNESKGKKALMVEGVFFATTFCIKLQKVFVGRCTYIL